MILVNRAIAPLIMSDHNPVVCVFRSKGKLFRWRFNEELLDKKKNMDYLQKEIKNFFELN